MKKKEKLKNKVNKIKGKLKIYLSESNNNIKINERIMAFDGVITTPIFRILNLL